MSKLFELKNTYLSIEDEINSSDEISEEQLMVFESIEDDIKEKSINIGYIIQNLESEIDSIDKAIKSMQLRQAKLMKKSNSLKEYLKLNLEVCNMKEIKSPYFDIKVKINPYSVLIENESLLPDSYFNEKITKIIDKISIRNDIKNNIFVPGAALSQTTRLEIK